MLISGLTLLHWCCKMSVVLAKIIERVAGVDLARKAHYDRNPLVICEFYAVSLGAHGTTTRYTYTVPASRKAVHCAIMANIQDQIGTAGKKCVAGFDLSTDGGSTWKRYARLDYYETGVPCSRPLSVTLTFYLLAGHKVRVVTYNNDTVNHHFYLSTTLLEFDE